MKIVLNKPYRQKGSNPYIYWVRAYFTSELEISMLIIQEKYSYYNIFTNFSHFYISLLKLPH